MKFLRSAVSKYFLDKMIKNHYKMKLGDTNGIRGEIDIDPVSNKTVEYQQNWPEYLSEMRL